MPPEPPGAASESMLGAAGGLQGNRNLYRSPDHAPPRRCRCRFAWGRVTWALLVQDGILVLPEFVNHRLYPQHQELVP